MRAFWPFRAFKRPEKQPECSEYRGGDIGVFLTSLLLQEIRAAANVDGCFRRKSVLAVSCFEEAREAARVLRISGPRYGRISYVSAIAGNKSGGQSTDASDARAFWTFCALGRPEKQPECSDALCFKGARDATRVLSTSGPRYGRRSTSLLPQEIKVAANVEGRCRRESVLAISCFEEAREAARVLRIPGPRHKRISSVSAIAGNKSGGQRQRTLQT